MHGNPIAVLDACVLYPALLRNVLLQLTTAELFRARWTEAIHDEWIRNLRADKPDITIEQVARYRDAMNRAVPDCVVTGYEPLMNGLALPDADDRHVLAAAIRCRAEVIVTVNVRDFPGAVLGPLGVRAEHPDTFVLQLIARSSEVVRASMKEVRNRLRNPPQTAERLVERLRDHGLVGSAAWLRGHIEHL